MALFPVIMCGGAGSRLWPASRPSRPKQFIALAGNRSLFQDTVERVAGLSTGSGQLIVIAGVAHGETIADQLEEIGITAQVLLEPEARDSGPAMAAAAAWVQRVDPRGIVAFVASDHYIPDAKAFRRAITHAAEGARAGQIVTLGVTPTSPSSAYGYIRPTGPDLSPVAAFHEKPDQDVAEQFIRDGYLWNSGNFIVAAATLAEEVERYAPAVMGAVRQALPPPSSGPSAQTLTDAFLDAPKISIDYAVMEQTSKASVLKSSFEWSDLGAWDAIAASGEGSTGVRILEDSERVLTRAPDGVLVAALGVRDLAIVVEHDAVLVCDLSRSQEIKRLVERVRKISPQHLDYHVAAPESLAAGARRLADWIRLRALPLWSSLGLGAEGGFMESISLVGRPTMGPRRARVQTRQIYVYATAGHMGWRGPWQTIVASACERLRASYLGPDGLTRGLLDHDWAVLDDSTAVYDQAFLLYALAMLQMAGAGGPDVEAEAVRLRDLLLAQALPNGALKEVGDHPFQSNAHMHLLEAALAWEAHGQDPGWKSLADRVAGLATASFIDEQGGFLREFFDEDWRPADGTDGRLVEPGHQFEWAWLLTRLARRRGDAAMEATARRLYDIGRLGVSQRPSVALDALNDDMTVRSRRARLWPQTEWLKAALILAESAEDGAREILLADAAAALRAVWLYLTPEGLWRDKRLPDGTFIDEPAPASSFYHLLSAFEQLSSTLTILGHDANEIQIS